MKERTTGGKLRGWRVLGLVLAALVLLSGCQSKLLYFPRPYPKDAVAEWEKTTGGKQIDYRTSEGRQKAFLQGNLKSPRNLWIVCGGNATVALDWAEWLTDNAPKEDAWLMVDFPGYGDCEGASSPGSIRENLKAAVSSAAQAVGWPTDPDSRRLRFFGHSLGSAACLMAATEFGVQRGILIAPFTSTMDMTRELTGVPLGMLVWHRFDNRAELQKLASRGSGRVIVFHGASDGVIPVTMSRTLAADGKGIVELREIAGGTHNSILSEHGGEVASALKEIGKSAE